MPRTLLDVVLTQEVGQEHDQDVHFYVKALLLKGAKLDAVDPTTENAPIHTIVRKADPDLLTMALPFWTGDRNVADGEGLTPLHVAAEQLQVRDCVNA